MSLLLRLNKIVIEVQLIVVTDASFDAYAVGKQRLLQRSANWGLSESGGSSRKAFLAFFRFFFCNLFFVIKQTSETKFSSVRETIVSFCLKKFSVLLVFSTLRFRGIKSCFLLLYENCQYFRKERLAGALVIDTKVKSRFAVIFPILLSCLLYTSTFIGEILPNWFLIEKDSVVKGKKQLKLRVLLENHFWNVFRAELLVSV